MDFWVCLEALQPLMRQCQTFIYTDQNSLSAVLFVPLILSCLMCLVGFNAAEQTYTRTNETIAFIIYFWCRFP